jgi:type IV pilus biogenesis protein CpaD/CtpE
MQTIRLPHALLVAGAVLAAGGAQAKHNFGVNSPNQPVVTLDRAEVPNCPNWKSAGLDSAAMTDTNYGCAVNSNLAAMIADPMDLVHGKSSDVTDTWSANRAIKAWREAEPTFKLYTPTVKENAKGGGQ